MGAAFDLDAARAARRDAIRAPFVFTIGKGAKKITATIPAPTEWDVQVTELLAAGNAKTATTLLLGDQAETVMAAGLTMGDLEALLDAASAFYGLGESAGE